MKDLTQGNEAKLVFYFALPMLIGNVFQQLYNTVDSIIVGKALGKEALASVGASFPVLFLLVSLIMGVTMGSTILISQYYGAKDFERVKKTIDTAYIFLFVGAIVITILGIGFSEPLLRILRLPEEIIPEAKTYLNIIYIGMIAMFGYNSISAILRGLGDSKTPLYFLILSTIINIVLDILFILVFHWGVAGAAWATVIAQTCSFIFGIYYLNKHHEVLEFKVTTMRFDGEIFKKSVKIGLPAGIQQMVFSFGIMAMQSILNPFGTDAIAAFTAASRIESFATMPIMNFGAAISTFVGQNMGANKPERVRKGYHMTVAMSAGVSIFVTLMLYFFKVPLISLFNTDPRVVEIGSRYLTIVGTFFVVISTMFVTTGVLRGAGDTIVPMVITLLGLWLVRIPVAAFLSQRIGTDGIWWSIPSGWMVGMILTLGYYATGRWKEKAVTQQQLRNEESLKREEK